MPAFRRRESSDSSMSTDNKPDNRTSSVREPEPWLGATANQALFFAMLMKLVFSFYDFKQLIETATVTMKDGTIAVHSPEHALEHAKGEKVGTARKPNPRRREDIASRLLNTNASATTAMPHGGHPTPSPPTSATATSSSKTPTLMESALGELASKYKIAPEIIEIKDNEILNYMISFFANDVPRLKELWLKKAGQHGGGARGFITAFASDMDRRGTSFTAEETTEVQMAQILEAGLPDLSFSGFLEMSTAYQELNEVCKHPKEDAEVAYKYKRVISGIDPKIENKLLQRIMLLENDARGRGEDPNDDPITLITEAAGIVLEEESTLEILKSLKSGRAFNSQGRFDPQRNPRSGGQPAGGQTWATDGGGPTVHTSDMRDCWFCENKYTSTPKHLRQHVDLECPNATPRWRWTPSARSASTRPRRSATRGRHARLPKRERCQRRPKVTTRWTTTTRPPPTASSRTAPTAIPWSSS